MDNIYDQIKSVATKHGFTLYALAEKMGISRQTLNNSMKSPSYPTLVRIADALEIPLWELFLTNDNVMPRPEIIATFIYKHESHYATTFDAVEQLVKKLKKDFLGLEEF